MCVRLESSMGVVGIFVCKKNNGLVEVFSWYEDGWFYFYRETGSILVFLCVCVGSI